MSRTVTFDNGRIELVHGDSHIELGKREDIGEVFDFVCCDPPYGIAYMGKGAHKAIAGDANPEDIAGWSIPAMFRLLKDNGAMYVCSRYDVQQVWWDVMKSLGMRIAPPITWDKRGWGMGDSFATHRLQVETILIGHRGRAPIRSWKWGDMPSWAGEYERLGVTADKEVRRDTCLWSFPVPKDRHSQLHPTPKPPEIMERAMLDHSDPNDYVLDPFMGGGPVGVAAVRQGRRYLGIETEERYFHLAVCNIAKAGGWEAPEDIVAKVAEYEAEEKARREALKKPKLEEF